MKTNIINKKLIPHKELDKIVGGRTGRPPLKAIINPKLGQDYLYKL